MTPIELNEFRKQTEFLHEVYTSVFQTMDILLQHESPFSQHEVLDEINIKMDRARQIERSIAPFRQSSAEKNEPIPQDVSERLASITTIIETLLPKINQLEAQARASKDDLSHGITKASRISQMQQAYAKHAQ